jgi:predicted phage terminase large subunit-like protein
MQRLHEDDFVSHVLGLGGDWEVINLPIIAEENEAVPFTTFLGQQVFRRKEGEALHPKRTSLAELEMMRASFGEAVWATQYQQRPTPAGGGLVKTDWLVRYQPQDLPDKFDRVVQSWDTANKTEEWHDYSVCTTWGVKGKHSYLLHVHRERLNYPALRQAVLRQAQLHDATEVYVEDHASGTQVIQELKGEGFGRIRPVKHTADKATRMVNQTALMENGFVHVPAEAPWLDDYLHELAMFPNGKHDDQVDSTSQALEAINSFKDGWGIWEYYRQEAEAKKEAEEEIWVFQPTPGTSQFHAIDGTVYSPDLDGLYRLPARHGRPALGIWGWKKLN